MKWRIRGVTHTAFFDLLVGWVFGMLIWVAAYLLCGALR